MAAHAQSPPRKVVVNGRVADESGDPVAGATIVERGTSNGVATLSEGEFSIAVLPGAVLDVSCLGYIDQSIGTGTRTEFEIVLQEDVKAIAEVIVTALGLERNYADLTYSADKIRGAQLTAVKDPNLILSLSGKSAGVQVNKNSSGAGASAKVSIRGVRSVASDNQPLYVVDGMPILNSTPEQAYSAIGGVADAGNRDGGDGISNLNAEDIESVSILKGAPAAALYGSQAANGVILITTKKGNARKQQPVTFTSNLTLQSLSLPAFQNRYGVSDGVESWGARARMKTYDNAGDFFRTGITAMNAVSVSSGSEQVQNYFSYANTAERGITGSNRLMRHNFNLRSHDRAFPATAQARREYQLHAPGGRGQTRAGRFLYEPAGRALPLPAGWTSRLTGSISRSMTPAANSMSRIGSPRATISSRTPTGSSTASAAGACATGSWPRVPPIGR